jgi:hypothetical protein
MAKPYNSDCMSPIASSSSSRSRERLPAWCAVTNCLTQRCSRAESILYRQPQGHVVVAAGMGAHACGARGGGGAKRPRLVSMLISAGLAGSCTPEIAAARRCCGTEVALIDRHEDRRAIPHSTALLPGIVASRPSMALPDINEKYSPRRGLWQQILWIWKRRRWHGLH